MWRTRCCHALASGCQDQKNVQILLKEYAKADTNRRKNNVSKLVLGLLGRWQREGGVGVETNKTAIALLAKHDLDRACLQVWEAGIRAQGLRLDPPTYNTLVRVLATAGNLEAMQQVWKEMKAFNVQPTVGTLQSFARCLTKRGYTKIAYDTLFVSMNLVKHLDSTIRVALRSCQSSREAFLYLDRVSEGTAISGNKEVNIELARVAARLGKTMTVEVLCRTIPFFSNTEQETWNLLLVAYAQNSDWMGSQVVWTRMLMAGGTPDAVHACTYLRCCAYHLTAHPSDIQAVSIAEDVFSKLVSAESPNHRLLTAMVRVYAIAKLAANGLSLYRWMRRNNIAPTEPFIQQARLILHPKDLGID